jgi:hypothetical protein
MPTPPSAFTCARAKRRTQRNNHGIREDLTKTTSVKAFFSVYKPIVRLPWKAVNYVQMFDTPTSSVTQPICRPRYTHLILFMLPSAFFFALPLI